MVVILEVDMMLVHFLFYYYLYLKLNDYNNKIFTIGIILGIFRESGIYNQLRSCARGMVIYGDTAYPISDVLISPYRKAVLHEQEQMFNIAMSKVRQAVEWGFQKVAAEFAFCDYFKNQKLLLQDVVAIYKTSVILTNCHTCLYGSQTGQYFDIEPPTLEEYLKEKDNYINYNN